MKNTPPTYGESSGPIIVACQWNISSPTGPAEQLAGGSFPKSTNSNDRVNKATELWSAIFNQRQTNLFIFLTFIDPLQWHFEIILFEKKRNLWFLNCKGKKSNKRVSWVGKTEFQIPRRSQYKHDVDQKPGLEIQPAMRAVTIPLGTRRSHKSPTVHYFFCSWISQESSVP